MSWPSKWHSRRSFLISFWTIGDKDLVILCKKFQFTENDRIHKKTLTFS